MDIKEINENDNYSVCLVKVLNKNCVFITNKVWKDYENDIRNCIELALEREMEIEVTENFEECLEEEMYQLGYEIEFLNVDVVI